MVGKHLYYLLNFSVLIFNSQRFSLTSSFSLKKTLLSQLPTPTTKTGNSVVIVSRADYILARWQKTGVGNRLSHILLLNLRDTYTSCRDERQQPDNYLSDRGRTDTSGCPHGE